MRNVVGVVLAQVVQPVPTKPAGIGDLFETYGGNAYWIIQLLLVIMMVVSGGKIAMGRFGRSNMAADGMSGAGYVLLGAMVASTAAALVNQVLTA